MNETASNAAPPTANRALIPTGQIVPFLLVTALFFLWGIPNNLNDVLIQHFMKSFEISRFGAAFIQFAFYLGYFLLAIPAALLMRRTSYKTGFLTGSCLYACGAFLLAGRQCAQLRILPRRPLYHRLRTLVP